MDYSGKLHESRERPASLADPFAAALDGAALTHSTPDRAMHTALDRLRRERPDLAEVLILRLAHRLSWADVALEVGCAPSTAYTRGREGLALLAKYVADARARPLDSSPQSPAPGPPSTSAEDPSG